MSDDSNMNALKGSQGERAAACVAAGCDVAMPCNGVLADNLDVANNVGELTPEGQGRLERAMATIKPDLSGMDFANSIATRDTLLALT